MLITRVFEPGDATRYTVHYGLTRTGESEPWMFFFAFGVGTDKGRWTQFDTRDIPNFSFPYFAECLGYGHKVDYHTAQVAFWVFLHLVAQERFVSDGWDRESEMDWSVFDTMPNLAQMLEGVSHA